MATQDISPMAQGFGQAQGQGAGGNFLSQIFSGLGGMFEDRDFIKFLSQTGTELDPQGIGGMLGRPTTQWVERDAAQEQMQQILPMLGGGQTQEQAQTQQQGQTQQQKRGTEPTTPTTKAASPDKERDTVMESPDFEAVLDNILGTLFPRTGGK